MAYKSDNTRVSEAIPLDLCRRILMISSDNIKDQNDFCVKLSDEVLAIVTDNLRGYERLARRIERVNYKAIDCMMADSRKAVSIAAFFKFIETIQMAGVDVDPRMIDVWNRFSDVVSHDQNNEQWLLEADDAADELMTVWIDLMQREGYYKNISLVVADIAA